MLTLKELWKDWRVQWRIHWTACVRSSIMTAWKDMEFVRKVGKRSKVKPSQIERLIWERRQLKKQWRWGDEQREGLSGLQAEVKSRMVKLWRTELLRRRMKKKEQARIAFYKNPFKFVKSWFTQKKTGSLRVEEKRPKGVYSTATCKQLADILPTGEVHQWKVACPGGERCKRCIVQGLHLIMSWP